MSELKSCVLLACRLHLSGDAHYPGPLEGKTIYVGAMVNIQQKELSFESMHHDRTNRSSTVLASLGALESGVAFTDND